MTNDAGRQWPPPPAVPSIPDYEDIDTETLPRPYVVRKPLKHREPLRGPIPDLKPAVRDNKLLNRFTEKERRSTEEENKSLKKYFLESAESRSVTPLGPWIERKAAKVRAFEQGEKVSRPPPPPLPAPKEPRVYTTDKIRFEKYSRWDCWRDNPAEFVDPKAASLEISRIAKILKDDPSLHVEIRASVGTYGPRSLLPAGCLDKAMAKRNELVSKRLEAVGINRARIHTEPGEILKGEEGWKVDFKIFVPAP